MLLHLLIVTYKALVNIKWLIKLNTNQYRELPVLVLSSAKDLFDHFDLKNIIL